jgi:hypothetical protein
MHFGRAAATQNAIYSSTPEYDDYVWFALSLSPCKFVSAGSTNLDVILGITELQHVSLRKSQIN